MPRAERISRQRWAERIPNLVVDQLRKIPPRWFLSDTVDIIGSGVSETDMEEAKAAVKTVQRTLGVNRQIVLKQDDRLDARVLGSQQGNRTSMSAVREYMRETQPSYSLIMPRILLTPHEFLDDSGYYETSAIADFEHGVAVIPVGTNLVRQLVTHEYGGHLEGFFRGFHHNTLGFQADHQSFETYFVGNNIDNSDYYHPCVMKPATGSTTDGKYTMHDAFCDRCETTAKDLRKVVKDAISMGVIRL